MTIRSELLQGTLDLLILKILNLEPMHGFGIGQRLAQISREVFQVNQGSLYPALHRLEQKGWIESEWGTTENNRKAKYYRLSKKGRGQLQQETEQWQVLSAAIKRVLQST
jgi:PadR family transcriptional regulator, regulatory protein PadR